MLMGVMCSLAGAGRRRSAVVAVGVALAISLATPLVWTSSRLRGLPWPLETYLNGVHTFKEPQAWLFPIFPWAGFAFAGLAAGFLLVSDWARKREARTIALLGAAGLALIALARWFDGRPRQVYAVYDFWHTSPNFFLIRVGLLLVILLAVYGWCRWGLALWAFSPMIQLGQTSLLVYWVHIEFVYGRFSILPKRSMSIGGASLGLAIIFLAMLLLSIARTRLKGRGRELAGRLFGRQPEKSAAVAR
jgi:fucose 4-O-acetylase-like acetyltransferase